MTPAPDAARVEAIRRAMEMVPSLVCSEMEPHECHNGEPDWAALAALVDGWIGPVEESMTFHSSCGACHEALAALPWRAPGREGG